MATLTVSISIIRVLPHQTGARGPNELAGRMETSMAPASTRTGGGGPASGSTASGPLVAGGWWTGWWSKLGPNPRAASTRMTATPAGTQSGWNMNPISVPAVAKARSIGNTESLAWWYRWSGIASCMVVTSVSRTSVAIPTTTGASGGFSQTGSRPWTVGMWRNP